jgi:hypothetical protein
MQAGLRIGCELRACRSLNGRLPPAVYCQREINASRSQTRFE